MTFWLFPIRRYRAWRNYSETRMALRELDIAARADIGVIWREIDAVARRAAG